MSATSGGDRPSDGLTIAPTRIWSDLDEPATRERCAVCPLTGQERRDEEGDVSVPVRVREVEHGASTVLGHDAASCLLRPIRASDRLD